MSLGLVCYDDSEESENEMDSEDKISLLNRNPSQSGVLGNSRTTVEQIDKSTSKSVLNSDAELEKSTSTNNQSKASSYEELGSQSNTEKTVVHLPESKLSLINTDIDIKCLTSTSKKNGPVKISIPSLNEVTDESEPPSRKKLKPSQKGSGLFALLPCPKSSLVPQSVFNKKPLTTVLKKPSFAATSSKNPLPKAPAVNKPSSLINYEDSGDEDETSESVDFFSLDSKSETGTPGDVNMDFLQTSQTSEQTGSLNNDSGILSFDSNWPITSNDSTSMLPSCDSPKTFHDLPTSSSCVCPAGDQYTTSDHISVSNNDLEFDQQAMKQLCGRRDRLKMQEVNLIDVSGDAIMPDSREWLTKQLTEETVHRPSHKRKDGPTTQQKRKHQITYLAYQAKENELELKNQWANNRVSRKQTQAKYGF